MTTFNLTLRPRFNDTDALGHINNASVATWFEEARLPVFQLFVPNLDVKAWNLIVASIQIQYKAQLHYQHEVQVVTLVQKIGTTSFTLLQLASQNSTLAAEGTATLVHFNYELQRPTPLTEAQRNQLSLWMSLI